MKLGQPNPWRRQRTTVTEDSEQDDTIALTDDDIIDVRDAPRGPPPLPMTDDWVLKDRGG